MTIKVKPLDWFEVERYRHGGKYTADGYTIRYIEGFFILDFAGESKTAWRFTTLEAAKAAAQAGYEARILAAIEPVDPATIRAEALSPERIAEIERGNARWHGEVLRSVRWEPYKPDGKRQMRTNGRWQEMVGSGDFWRWSNCERPSQVLALIDKEQDQ